MKKELFALLTILLLLLGAASSFVHLSRLTEQIETHIDYSLLYCSLDDYEAAHTEITKALETWKHSERYTQVLIRQSEADNAALLFYDILAAIQNRQKYSAAYQLEKLRHQITGIEKIESISIESIF